MTWPFDPGQSAFHVKGLVYRTFIAEIASTVGLPQLFALVEDPKLLEFLQQPFLAASWYDCAPLIALNSIMAKAMGCTLQELYVERTRKQAEQDLGGVYSFVLKIMSPNAVAKTMPRLTARYFDWGGVEVRERGPRDLLMVRTGVPVYFADWYEHVAAEYMRVALRKAGAKDLQIVATTKPSGSSHGVPVCRLEYSVTW